MGGVTTGDGVEIIDGGDMVDEVVDMDVGPETSVVADTILWSWAEGVCDTVGVDVVTSVGDVTTGDGVGIIDGGDMVDEVVDTDVGAEASVGADTIL